MTGLLLALCAVCVLVALFRLNLDWFSASLLALPALVTDRIFVARSREGTARVPRRFEPLLWLIASLLIMELIRAKNLLRFGHEVTEFGAWLSIYVIFMLAAGLADDLRNLRGIAFNWRAAWIRSAPGRSSLSSKFFDACSLFSYLVRSYLFWVAVAYAILVIMHFH